MESFHLRRLKGRKESRIQSATVQTRGDGFAGMTKSLSPVGPNVACRNTGQELPIRLTSYIPIPKTPRTEPGKMTLHYCQRTTASGLLPAGIAVYVQRGPNGIGLEMRYPVGLEDLTSLWERGRSNSLRPSWEAGISAARLNFFIAHSTPVNNYQNVCPVFVLWQS